MLSNLVNQLKEMDAIDKIDEVFRQLPIVRSELGQVPLVTPTSQIVGIQTVNNVLFDTANERYKMITAQVKDLCYGLYGQTPVPIDPEVQKKALKDYPRGENPITVRPADVLEPELEKAKHEVDGLAKDIDDVLVYALYPTTGKRFLKWKYGLEEIPQEVHPKTIEEVKAEEVLVKNAKAGLHVEKPKREAPPQGSGMRTFTVYLNGTAYDVALEQTGGEPLIVASTPLKQTATSPLPSLTSLPRVSALPEAAAVTFLSSAPYVNPASRGTAAGSDPGTLIVAPMPGLIIRYEVDKGTLVNEGDVVLILEAMKMENFIVSPVKGVVREIPFKNGESVKKNDVLAVIM
jgi:pyruvate carboxylase subunit B